MKKITSDIDNIVTLAQKEKLLEDLGYKELIDLFVNDYKPPISRPARHKKTPLDQQLSVSISEEERKKLEDTLLEIKSVGPRISISAYIRNQALQEIDIEEWADQALKGLKELSGNDYNPTYLKTKKVEYMRYMERLGNETEEDLETQKVYAKKIEEIDERLDDIKRTFAKRKYRLTGRVTFNEATEIKWRAARLGIFLADYLRFLVFGYLPNTGEENHMTIEQRKRFYISILDIQRNGWGRPPEIEYCPNCARYQEEAKALRKQLELYQKFSQK